MARGKNAEKKSSHPVYNIALLVLACHMSEYEYSCKALWLRHVLAGGYLTASAEIGPDVTTAAV